jgi:hypothetical protein
MGRPRFWQVPTLFEDLSRSYGEQFLGELFVRGTGTFALLTPVSRVVDPPNLGISSTIEAQRKPPRIGSSEEFRTC